MEKVVEENQEVDKCREEVFKKLWWTNWWGCEGEEWRINQRRLEGPRGTWPWSRALPQWADMEASRSLIQQKSSNSGVYVEERKTWCVCRGKGCCRDNVSTGLKTQTGLDKMRKEARKGSKMERNLLLILRSLYGAPGRSQVLRLIKGHRPCPLWVQSLADLREGLK